MRAGLLRKQVTLLRCENESTDYSTGSPVWKQAFTTRARLVYDKGTLTDKNGEPFYEESITLTLRHFHNINPVWRVRIDGRDWQQTRPPVKDMQQMCQYLYLIPVNK